MEFLIFSISGEVAYYNKNLAARSKLLTYTITKQPKLTYIFTETEMAS
jgi:hypothetical protein